MVLVNSRRRSIRYGLSASILGIALVSAIAVAARDRLPAPPPDVQAAASLDSATAPSPSRGPDGGDAVLDPRGTDPNPRVAVVSDHAVQQESSDADPKTPAPEPPRLGFHRHPPFPSALECAQDPRFNPTGAKLEGDDLARLESIISSWNRYLQELEMKKIGLAESLAMGIIDQGLATPIENGVEVPAVAGSISVTVTSAGHHAPHLVVIRPGDFAELDLVALELEGIVEAGRSDIQEFFATL